MIPVPVLPGRRKLGDVMMNRRCLLYVLALALMAVSRPAHAQVASTLLRECQIGLQYMSGYSVFPNSDWSKHWSGICTGYISGIFFAGPQAKLFCPPPEADNKMAMFTVVRYMQSHPDRLSLPLPAVAVEAMSASWPCK